MPATQSILRRFTFIFAAVAVTVLSGCATSQQAYLADSSPAQSIQCNGVFGSWDACRSQAVIACGDTGYQVIARNHIDGLSEPEAEQRVASQSFHERNMLIQCGVGATRLAGLSSPSDASAEL
ncbi:hypothetical protein [Pseudomonas baltica]|uniref:hypothetical protein n=1 Tax=Pseudomonas baltica TaxID=2762576 RepID=UPI002897BF5F|nr:hypothetical protein [Pseudomonas baltica]